MSEITKQSDAGIPTLTTTIIPATQVFEGLDVRRAIFHQSVDVPNGGGAASSLYAKRGAGTGRSAISDVSMKYNKDGLFCTFKGSSFVVPLANVIVCYL